MADLRARGAEEQHWESCWRHARADRPTRPEDCDFQCPTPEPTIATVAKGHLHEESVGREFAEAVIGSPELRSTMKAMSEPAWVLYWTRAWKDA